MDNSASFSGSSRGIKGDLWNYNPAPVFRGMSFWVMLVDSNVTNFAQVGWLKGNNDSVEYVFSEFLGVSGWERYFYDAASDRWVGTQATSPTSSKNYKVT